MAMEGEVLDVDVTGCRVAEFFHELGEAELGFALLCAFDDIVAEEMGAGEVQLTRWAPSCRDAALRLSPRPQEARDLRSGTKRASSPSVEGNAPASC
jgi:hypothetical protein